MTIQDAAKKLGCHYNTIYKYVRKGLIKSTRNEGHHPANKIDITQEALDEFAKKPEDLLTKEEIATIKGVSVRTVESWVLKRKLKPVTTYLKRNYFARKDVE